ncbi:hypothetical protein BTUL_0045g00080 [Botrytis tulipae]|uniref:Uncharacterized protein n=1 Tax=Botrytis tulipae TaxID=87230 RepID=A0A4Z1EU75_9HELO|nr:hypothetical protein BTUL_0045g00080 [Botrytis tulipae]
MGNYTLFRLELLFAGQFIDFEQALLEHTSDGGARANLVERSVPDFEEDTDDCAKQSTKRMVQEKLPTMSVSRSVDDDARRFNHKRVKMEAQLLLNDIDDSQTMKSSEATPHTNKLYVVPDRGFQVILAAGASSAEYNAIIQRYTKGVGEELKMGTNHLNGWYFPYHKAIQIAKEWNVIDLIGGLLVHDMPSDEEAERLNDSWLNATQILADSSAEDDVNVEVESEAMVKQNWRSLSLTKSTGTSSQNSLDNVGQMIVISRNTSNGTGRRPRARLLADGLASFNSFKKYFGVNFSGIPTVVGFNGLSSTASARYNVSSNGDNVIDKDRERIIDGVRATPEGTKCVILIRGIDGWTSNVESLREFSRAFVHVDIWLISAVIKGWGHSEAWHEASNGVRYNVFPMSALSVPLPSWQVSHFVTVLEKIQHEKKQGRGAHIGWLTRGRAFVL